MGDGASNKQIGTLAFPEIPFLDENGKRFALIIEPCAQAGNNEPLFFMRVEHNGLGVADANTGYDRFKLLVLVQIC